MHDGFPLKKAALAQFQHRFGAPWTHIDDGVVYMRARLPAGEDGERLAHQVRGYLAKSKADAHVTVQEFSTHDYGVWDDLIQASSASRPDHPCAGMLLEFTCLPAALLDGRGRRHM